MEVVISESSGGRSGEEADLLERSTKKAKPSEGDGVVHEVPMQDTVVSVEEAARDDGLRTVNPQPNLPVSYREKLLNINGAHNEDLEGDETDWMDDDMDREEDELLIPMEQQDPLCPVVEVSAQERREWSKPWKSSLIVNLLGRKLGFRFLKSRLEKMWGVQGAMQMIDIGNDFYVVQLSNKEDYRNALENGPWLIADHYLVVQRWRPDFDLYDAEYRKLAVWVRVPRLPLEYYNQRFLWHLGNRIGKTLKVDLHTLRSQDDQAVTERGRFARVCVEVDLRKQLIPKVLLRKRTLPVQYEGLHFICFGCGRFGHRKDECPAGIQTRQGTETVVNPDGSSRTEPRTDGLKVPFRLVTGETDGGRVLAGEEAFRGWMAPQRQIRK